MLLNQCDPRDLYALHLVFLPKIQEQLDQFRLGWCHHKLRTEQNKTPYQLWITGMSINFADQLPSDVSKLKIIIVFIIDSLLSCTADRDQFFYFWNRLGWPNS